MKKFFSFLVLIIAIFCVFNDNAYAQLGQSPFPGTGLDTTTTTFLKPSNRAFSTIGNVGGISAVATTLTLNDASLFPTSGAITIDDERIYFAGKTGSQLTGLLRGQDGSVAASHSQGATVGMRVIARHVSMLQEVAVALEAKVGWGADIPALNEFLIGTGTGTSGWRAIVAGDIPNDTITFAKFQNINTSRLLGRTIASSGDVEEISIGTGLTFGTGSLSLTRYEYNIVEFGADQTCTTDSLAAIHAARDALRAASIKRGRIYVPAGCYLISGSIILGNGTATTVTTVDNGVTLEGDGGVRTTSPTETLRAQTEFKYTGAPDTTTPMIDIRGPIGGVKIKGIYLNADSKAGVGIKVVHAQSAALEDISIFAFRGIGLDVTSWNTGSFNGGAEVTGLFGDNGSLKNFLFNSAATSNLIGVRLGSTGTTANWYFERGQVRLDGATSSAAIELGHTDHSVFVNVVASSEIGIRVKPIAIAPNFPMNTSFYAGAYTGNRSVSTANGAIAVGATNITVADASLFPTNGIGQIDNGKETFSWTGKTGNILNNVVRGKYDTQDVAHLTGVAVVVAMSVTIDETVAWTPTTGYDGLRFFPFNTADGSIFPTSKHIKGVTDNGKSYGTSKLLVSTPVNRSVPAAGQNNLIHSSGGDGEIALNIIDSYGTAGVSGLVGRHARGTIAAPTAAVTDSTLFTFGARGWHSGGSFTTGNSATISFLAAEDWVGTIPTNPTETGSYITFNTTPINSTSRAERMRILDSGRMLIGTTTDNGTDRLQVSGTVLATNFKGATVGVTTNSSAAAGEVGEFIEGTAGFTTVSLVNATAKTVTSISLTAGDWDVDAILYFTTAATTNVTDLISCISLTNNALNVTPGWLTEDIYPSTVFGAGTKSQTVPPVRISLASTTTVYLVADAFFTVSTMTSGGNISARRVR